MFGQTFICDVSTIWKVRRGKGAGHGNNVGQRGRLHRYQQYIHTIQQQKHPISIGVSKKLRVQTCSKTFSQSFFIVNTGPGIPCLSEKASNLCDDDDRNRAKKKEERMKEAATHSAKVTQFFYQAHTARCEWESFRSGRDGILAEKTSS